MRKSGFWLDQRADIIFLELPGLAYLIIEALRGMAVMGTARRSLEVNSVFGWECGVWWAAGETANIL